MWLAGYVRALAVFVRNSVKSLTGAKHQKLFKRMEPDSGRILELLGEAKRIAKEYRALTGRPLGITGEVAEYEAVRLLGLKLAAVRQAGYDAIRRDHGGVCRLQIKGRCLPNGSKPSQRLGSIRLDKEWDAVLMVLMDENFEAVEIYEADRSTITAALLAPGSKARNKRGALAVSKFRSIGHLVWARDPNCTK